MPKQHIVLTPDQLATIEMQVDAIQQSVMQLTYSIVQVYGFREQQVKELIRSAEALEKWHEKMLERQAEAVEKVAAPSKGKKPKKEKPEVEPGEDAGEAPPEVVVSE